MQNYNKYIKYKTKYLNLKTQIGGGTRENKCAFCNSTDNLTLKEHNYKDRYYFCKRCKRIGKDEYFIYYYNITTNKYITYRMTIKKTDKNIIDFSKEDKVIVFDVHNVIDRYEPKEFKKIVNTLSKDIKIVILSYVGNITGTRLYTQQYLKNNFSEFDNKFFCFKKNSYCEPGTKGFFMQRLGAEKIILFDDSQKNIDSAFDCGKKAVKIHSKREENNKDIILARKNIEDAVNSINNIGFDRFYTSLKNHK